MSNQLDYLGRSKLELQLKEQYRDAKLSIAEISHIAVEVHYSDHFEQFYKNLGEAWQRADAPNKAILRDALSTIFKHDGLLHLMYYDCGSYMGKRCVEKCQNST